MSQQGCKIRILFISAPRGSCYAFYRWLLKNHRELQIGHFPQTESISQEKLASIINHCREGKWHFVAIDDTLVPHDTLLYGRLKEELHPTICLLLANRQIRTSRVTDKVWAEIIPFHGRTNRHEAYGKLVDLASRYFGKVHGDWHDHGHNVTLHDYIQAAKLPEPEAIELINRLFYHEQNLEWYSIGKFRVIDDEKGSNSVKSGSFVLVAEPNNRIPVIVKLAHRERIDEEYRRYQKYVAGQLDGFRYALIETCHQSWELGGIKYALLGGLLQRDRSEVSTFRERYLDFQEKAINIPPIDAQPEVTKENPYEAIQDQIDGICFSLVHLFKTVWYQHYKYHYKLNQPYLDIDSFIDEYDKIWSKPYRDKRWKDKFKENLHPEDLHKQAPYLHYSHVISHPLPNPVYWAWKNKLRRKFHVRQAITHGDLHADNLFVDRHNECWVIDFERTGPGPILQDLVELEVDLVTRLTHFHKGNLTDPDRLFYEFALMITDFQTVKSSIHEKLPQHWGRHLHFSIDILKTLRTLAHEVTGYTEIEEYLWGLLMNVLFVIELTAGNPELQHRQRKALILGGVICWRLGLCAEPEQWPPYNWYQL